MARALAEWQPPVITAREVVREVSAPVVVGVPRVQNVHEQYFEQPSTRKKPSKTLQRAIEWLQEYDPDEHLTVRDAAAGAGVSVGTIHNARALMKERS